MSRREPMDDDFFPDDEPEAGGFGALIHKPLHLGVWCLGFGLHLVGAVAYAIWTFFRQWATSRPFAPLAWGVPAVVAVVVVGLLAATGARLSSSDLVVEYREAAAQAAGKGDTKSVELWLEKAVQLNPNDKMFRFNLALTAQQDGRLDRARQIMRRLAPDDEIGYGPAHLWIAYDLTKSKESIDAQRAGQVRHHLTAGLKHDSGDVAAREQLGRLELQQGNLAQAIEQYERLVRKDRTFSLVLARLHAAQGEPNRSRNVAESGIDYFRHQVTKDPEDVESRIHWALLHGFMERFDRAVEILSDGLKRKPEADDVDWLRIQLSGALLGWSNYVKQTEPDKLAFRLNLLQQALKLSPDNPDVLEQLAMLAAGDSEEVEAAHEALTAALGKGTATPMVHLILGIAALRRGEYEREQHHLRLALAADPGLVVAANNLAWRLANGDPPQLEEALELIEQAVRQSPDYAVLRSTRGRIYQLLDRPEDAIVELEFALARLKDRPDIHAALADLYTTVGDEDLARVHHELAAKTDLKPSGR